MEYDALGRRIEKIVGNADATDANDAADWEAALHFYFDGLGTPEASGEGGWRTIEQRSENASGDPLGDADFLRTIGTLLHRDQLPKRPGRKRNGRNRLCG